MDGVWGVQLWGVQLWGMRLWCLSTVQNCCQHLQRSSHPCLEFMGLKGTGYLSVSRSRKQIFPVAPEFIYFLSFFLFFSGLMMGSGVKQWWALGLRMIILLQN